MNFQGLIWMGTVIDRARSSGDTEALEALVRSAVEFLSNNPDSGASRFGWDEGTNLRRQQSLNCLFRATDGDERLVPLIEATAAANLDMTRYYGPPKRIPHNHGVMANLFLLDAGRLLERPQWVSAAFDRLLTGVKAAFTPAGFSIEQSAEYALVNISLWERVADALAESGLPSAATKIAEIRRETARARSAVAYLTDPSKQLVTYGDSNTGAGIVAPQPRAVVRDDVAGLVTGRWSWTDPATSFYMVRYGPPRMAHGHEDRTALVWSTLGVPVLVDPGRFSYDAGPYKAFQLAPFGHSVQIVRGRPFNPAARVSLVLQRSSGPAHRLMTRDTQYGVAHTRNWVIDDAHHSVRLDDVVSAKTTTTLHLDASWRLVRLAPHAKKATFAHPSSRRLVVTTTTPMKIMSGSTRPVGGWAFPEYGRRVPAPQIVFYGTGGLTGASLTVT